MKNAVGQSVSMTPLKTVGFETKPLLALLSLLSFSSYTARLFRAAYPAFTRVLMSNRKKTVRSVRFFSLDLPSSSSHKASILEVGEREGVFRSPTSSLQMKKNKKNCQIFIVAMPPN